MSKEAIYKRDHRISNEQEVFEDIKNLLLEPTNENIEMAGTILFLARKNFDEPVEKLLSLDIDDTIKEKIVFKIRSYEINDKYAFDFVKANVNVGNDPFYCINETKVKQEIINTVFKPNFKDEVLRNEVVKHLATLEYAELDNLSRCILDHSGDLYDLDSKLNTEINNLSKILVKKNFYLTSLICSAIQDNPAEKLLKPSYEKSLINYIIDNFEDRFLHETITIDYLDFTRTLSLMEDYGVAEFNHNDPVIQLINAYIKENDFDLSNEDRVFLEKLEVRNNLEFF